jgi:acyl-CoA thioester hydrolase
MDAANHVNNLIYLRWAESARIKYFEKMGMDISFGAGETGPILGWQECKYIFPITYPDTAIVGVRTIEIQEDRFFVECAVFSDRHNRIAAISKQSIIPYDYGALKKVAMPETWLEGIRRIEGKIPGQKLDFK